MEDAGGGRAVLKSREYLVGKGFGGCYIRCKKGGIRGAAEAWSGEGKSLAGLGLCHFA